MPRIFVCCEGPVAAKARGFFCSGICTAVSFLSEEEMLEPASCAASGQKWRRFRFYCFGGAMRNACRAVYCRDNSFEKPGA